MYVLSFFPLCVFGRVFLELQVLMAQMALREKGEGREYLAWTERREILEKLDAKELQLVLGPTLHTCMIDAM